MGRRHLTVLRSWADCDRCARASSALGVLAPTWPRAPTILVVGFVADRAAQSVGRPSPRLEKFASELAESVDGLVAADVQLEVLVACGLGTNTALDHVAACSGRFVENASAVGPPSVVVLVGEYTWAAAQGAGLIVAGKWSPVGQRAVPALRAERAAVSKELSQDVAAILGSSRRVPQARRRIAYSAPFLHGVLGGHRGSRLLRRNALAWTTRPRQQLTLKKVVAHLRCWYSVAPFMPSGAWKYVVVDVDRHNAIQAERFDTTLASIRKLLPRSLYLQSSKGGGVHVYVRLPPDTEYGHAALWLQAMFAKHGLLSIEKKVRRNGEVHRVHAAAVEVPLQPVRLPFGDGSQILGSTARLATQISEFVTFVNGTDYSDFERARSFGSQAAAITKNWSGRTRPALLRYIEQQSVTQTNIPRLSPTGPFKDVLPLLEKYDALSSRGKNVALRRVVTEGIPAMGTRSFWSQRLLKVLLDVVEPAEAERLMFFWLRSRPHQSEDIQVNIVGVERAMKELIDKKKSELVGVPKTTWQVVQNQVDPAFARTSTSKKTRDGTPLELDAVRRTAFFLLRRYIQNEVSQRAVPRREFMRFVPWDLGTSVRDILVNGTWFYRGGRAVPGGTSCPLRHHSHARPTARSRRGGVLRSAVMIPRQNQGDRCLKAVPQRT